MDFKTTGKRIAIALSLMLFASSVLAAEPSYCIQVAGLSCPFVAYGIEKKDESRGWSLYLSDRCGDRPKGRRLHGDGYGNRIQVFGADGAFLRKWGGPIARGIYGPFNGWFMTVTSIAFGPEGNLFAADFYNHRVEKFRPDGTFLASFGSKGTGPGQFDHAIAVAVSHDGAMFVADFLNNRIQKWRPTEP